MAFVGVQFEENEVAVIHAKWLSPKKQHTFWPTTKTQLLFNKLLLQGVEPDDTWPTYSVTRRFFETDDFRKAQAYLEKIQFSSDISEIEGDEVTKRSVKKPKRFLDLLDYDSDESVESGLNLDINKKKKLKRPPPILEESNHSQALDNILISTSSAALNDDYACRTPESQYSSVRVTGQISTPSSTISLCRSDDNDVLKSILKSVIQIKQQNQQIINQNEVLMRSLENRNSALEPPKIPVELPLRTLEDLESLEVYLANDSTTFTTYLSSFGGKGVSTKTNIILKHVLTNGLASSFSYLGTRNNKKAFSSLKLCGAIIKAVQLQVPNLTESEVAACVKVWLKHSTQRLSLGKKAIDKHSV